MAGLFFYFCFLLVVIKYARHTHRARMWIFWRSYRCAKKTGIAFSYVSVLANPFIRERLSRISLWPTYPQLFVQGELIGGADIISEMLADGSLQKLLATVPNAQPDTQSDMQTFSEQQHVLSIIQ